MSSRPTLPPPSPLALHWWNFPQRRPQTQIFPPSTTYYTPASSAVEGSLQRDLGGVVQYQAGSHQEYRDISLCYHQGVCLSKKESNVKNKQTKTELVWGWEGTSKAGFDLLVPTGQEFRCIPKFIYCHCSNRQISEDLLVEPLLVGLGLLVCFVLFCDCRRTTLSSPQFLSRDTWRNRFKSQHYNVDLNKTVHLQSLTFVTYIYL